MTKISQTYNPLWRILPINSAFTSKDFKSRSPSLIPPADSWFGNSIWLNPISLRLTTCLASLLTLKGTASMDPFAGRWEMWWSVATTSVIVHSHNTNSSCYQFNWTKEPKLKTPSTTPGATPLHRLCNMSMSHWNSTMKTADDWRIS